MLPKYKDPDEILATLRQRERESREAYQNLARLSELSLEERTAAYRNIRLSDEIYYLRFEHSEMLFFKSILECFDIYGKVYISRWQRDSDCVEFTRAFSFDSVEEAWQHIQAEYDNAEGIITFDVISEQDYVGFVPQERDRILQAFEDDVAPFAV